MSCHRGIRSAAAAAVALSVLYVAPVRAQFSYPGGYGGYGWGGWGGASTGQGDIARGLGVFAAGAGQYNVATAEAISINANTAMQWNQYLYGSALESANRYHRKMAKQILGNEQASDQIVTRLRDNPEPNDIYRGDALNVAKNEIDNPKIYMKTLQNAKVKIGGEAIRDIPFQYAAGAITTSVHELMSGGPPDLLKTPMFEAERTELRKVADAIRKQSEDGGDVDPKLLEKAREKIKAIRDKLEARVPKNTRGYTESEKYLKACYGLTRMLEGPSINVILSGAEKRPDATLAELLSFMNAFNLRFGPAKTPRERQVYEKIYPMLVAVRKEVAPALATSKTETAARDHAHAAEFFSGMQYKDIENAPPPPPKPPVPEPKPN